MAQPCAALEAPREVQCPGPGIPGHRPRPMPPRPLLQPSQRRPGAARAACLVLAWCCFLGCTALVSSASKQRNARRGAEMGPQRGPGAGAISGEAGRGVGGGGVGSYPKGPS